MSLSDVYFLLELSTVALKELRESSDVLCPELSAMLLDKLENVTWRRGCFLSPSLPQKHKDEGDKGRE